MEATSFSGQTPRVAPNLRTYAFKGMFGQHPQSETLANATWATPGVAHGHADRPAQSRDPTAFDSFFVCLVIRWLLSRILRHLFQSSVFTSGADRFHFGPSHESAHAARREPLPHAARYSRPVAGEDADAP